MKVLKNSILKCFYIGLTIAIIFSIVKYKNITVLVFGINFLISFIYSFVISYGNILIINFLNTKWDWLENTNERVTYGIIFSILYTVPAVIFLNYLNLEYISDKGLFSTEMLWIHLFYIILSLGITTFLQAKSFIKSWKEASKKEIVKHQVIANDSSAKFESLKNQIDPHFLFNSLNVLSALIEEKPENAVNFTNSLSKIYRYILEEKDKELNTLEDEIIFADTYIKLLKMRFENAIEYNVEPIENSNQLYVVPLCLQLLLENTVKHNNVNENSPLIINIKKEGDYLFITNNLQKKESSGRRGVGIQNIVSRYNIVTDKKVEIIETKEEFIVKIPILKQKINIMETKNTDEIVYLKAKRRLKELKEFYGNLFSYCIIIPVLIAINLYTYSKFIWFVFPMLGWGVGLAIHAFTTFGYGKEWEDKKIRELMKN
jgi:sensor histidine kinase YesM